MDSHQEKTQNQIKKKAFRINYNLFGRIPCWLYIGIPKCAVFYTWDITRAVKDLREIIDVNSHKIIISNPIDYTAPLFLINTPPHRDDSLYRTRDVNETVFHNRCRRWWHFTHCRDRQMCIASVQSGYEVHRHVVIYYVICVLYSTHICLAKRNVYLNR